MKNIAQQLLMDNKQLLQSIIDNTSNSISIKLINGEYLLVNKQFETLFRISKDDIKGKTDHDFLPKEIADSYRNTDLEVLKAGKELKVEEIIKDEHGDQTYLAVKFPLYDIMGRIYAVGAISTNISERKSAEDSLKIGDKFFKMSLEILVIASNDSFVKVNPALSKTLGYSDKELLEKPFITFIHPDDVEITQNEIKKLESGVSTINFENRWVCKDGSIIWLSWIATIDVNNLLYAITHDITERRAKEEQIHQLNINLENNLRLVKGNEEKFRVIFEGAPDSVITINDDGIITGWNSQAEQMFGYQKSEVIGKTLTENIIPERYRVDHTKGMKHFLETGEGPVLNKSIEIFALKKDQTEFPIELKISSSLEADNKYVFIAFIRDITHRKKIEDELKIAEKFFNTSFDILFVAKGRKFIKINPGFTKSIGYNMEDLEDKTFLDVLHQDDRQIALDRIAAMMQGSPKSTYIYRVLCKDGTYKLIEVLSSVDTLLGTIYSVGRDVTEKVKAEESLKIADMSFDMMVVGKGEFFIKVNSAFTRILGYDQKEMSDKPFLSFSHPDDFENTKAVILKLRKGESVSNFKARALCKDGKYKWLDWTCSSDLKTGLVYLVGRDITEQLKLEEEKQIGVNKLYENEQKLQLILENISDGVIVTDTDKKILLANYRANELFDLEEDKQISANFLDQFELYMPDEKTIFPSQLLPIDRALNGEATDDIDLVMINLASQEKKRVLISGRPIIDKENQVLAAVITIKDISNYKKLEAELKETESKYRDLIGFKKNE